MRKRLWLMEATDLTGQHRADSRLVLTVTLERLPSFGRYATQVLID